MSISFQLEKRVILSGSDLKRLVFIAPSGSIYKLPLTNSHGLRKLVKNGYYKKRLAFLNYPYW